MTEEQILAIAIAAHEMNRAFCSVNGDNSQLPWDAAPEWQRNSAVLGVKFRLDNPTAPSSATHDSWLKQKYADGWKYGPVKDADKKEHPCCVPYEELPTYQKYKDTLFDAVVKLVKFIPTNS